MILILVCLVPILLVSTKKLASYGHLFSISTAYSSSTKPPYIILLCDQQRKINEDARSNKSKNLNFNPLVLTSNLRAPGAGDRGFIVAEDDRPRRAATRSRQEAASAPASRDERRIVLNFELE
jgi:hypothetical protein